MMRCQTRTAPAPSNDTSNVPVEFHAEAATGVALSRSRTAGGAPGRQMSYMCTWHQTHFETQFALHQQARSQLESCRDGVEEESKELKKRDGICQERES
jgi:hypothetical protein